MQRNDHWDMQTLFLFVIAVSTGTFVLRELSLLTLPFAFALVILFLILPVKEKTARLMPKKFKWVGVIAAMLSIILIIGLVMLVIWFAVGQVQAGFGPYIDLLTQKWQKIGDYVTRYGFTLPGKEEVSNSASRILSITAGVSKTLLSSLSVFIVAFFCVLLMLLEWDNWIDAISRDFSPEKRAMVLKTIDTAGMKMRRYFLVKTFVSFITALATMLWLWLLKVDFVIVWGVLVFFLNFLPNIGSVLAIIGPAIIAFLQFDAAYAVLVVGGYTAIDLVMGNYIDPRLSGQALKISPVFLLGSLLFWGWVWGWIGAFLAIPLGVLVILVSSQIPSLRPLVILFSPRLAEENKQSQK